VTSLPRAQEGANPQHLIMTLLGDYWYGREEYLPSSGLVAIAAEFDVSEASARVALSRLYRRGMLTSVRQGRRTFYAIHPEVRSVLGANRDRAVAFLSGPDTSWDGRWTVITFSIPENQRGVRHALRTRLRALGFGAVYDGVWVSPRPLADVAMKELVSMEVEHATVFRADVVSPETPGPGHPLAAWNLDEVRGEYEQFLSRFQPLVRRIRAGTVGASEALVSRTAVMDTWRRFPRLDPDLPARLLPDGWPRMRARDLFLEVYEALGPLAELRFRQILREHAPELAELVHYHAADAR
jgi:phenylacetic acid degradation operon negative regulatory protein